MSHRLDLERRVAERLVAVTDTEMQVIAEEFARIQFPARFSNLQVFGRNAQGQPTIGWPDAGVVKTDGRIDAIEATRARAQDWRAHIRNDLEKAKRADYPNLAGFVFVAGHPEARCSAEERIDWQRKFISAGVSEESIHVIIGMDLVRRLCDPEFARLRYELLGLAPSPNHFELVIWTEANERPGAFEPTRQEFLQGYVHRPALLNDVINRIAAHGWTVVLGSGASGKTVLAQLLTLESPFNFLPSYYLNLAQFEGPDSHISNELTADLANFGHRESLFILDNIHLNEHIAHVFFEAWKSSPAQHRPRLLLLGRETRYGKGTRFGGPLVNPLILRARGDEIVGVINRLARRWFRENGREEAALAPPPEAILNLLWTFGGDPSKPNTTVDLMALSAAVKRRLEQVVGGDWTLTEDDARAEVRDTYLRQITEAERRNLIRLAVLPDDFQLSERGLVDEFTGFRKSTERGLVFEKEVRKLKLLRYHFVHSALGRLIRSASENLPVKKAEYREVAISAPIDGFYLASRLKDDGNQDEAKEVLDAIWKGSNWIAQFDGNLSHLQGACNLLLRSEIVSIDEVNNFFSSQQKAIEALMLRTSLDMTGAFLAYADRVGLVSARKAVVDALKRQPPDYLGAEASRVAMSNLVGFLAYADRNGLHPQSELIIAALEKKADELSARLLGTGLNTLIAFFIYAERRNLRSLFEAVIVGLERSPEDLAVATFEAGLNEIAAFLDYSDRAELRPFRNRVIKELEKQPDHLAAAALENGLNDLATFLSYTNRAELFSFSEVVVKSLNNNSWQLADTAIHTRFDHLSHFLKFTACPPLQSLHDNLMSKLLTPNSIDILSERACREPLTAFVTLLEVRPLADRIVAAIDREKWDRCRAAADSEQPTFFAPLVRKLTALGRSELAEAPARSQVSGVRGESWKASGLNLVQLTYILRLAKPSEMELDRFLSEVLTPAWQEGQYRNAEIGSIAGAFFWIASQLDMIHWPRFLHPSLETRIRVSLEDCGRGWTQQWAEALSALGAFAAVGGNTTSMRLLWPDSEMIFNIIATRTKGSEQERISTLEFQLWLGLREMARLNPIQVSISPSTGDRILSRVRVNLSYASSGGLTEKLIAWLEECKRENWILVK